MNQQSGNQQSGSKEQGTTPASKSGIPRSLASGWIIGIYLLALTILAVATLIMIWPVKDSDGGWIQKATLPFTSELCLTDDLRLLLIVVLAGAVGSCIGAQTSFATFVGNRMFVSSWTWWYVLRPFIGMALALVFYFVIRGGLLSVSSGADEMSPYGVAAVAALVGLFSKQAADKLEEVFTTMFRTEKGKGDDLRGDKAVDDSLVSQHMIPLRKIKRYTIPESKKSSDILIKYIAELIKPGITRIPILDNKNLATGVVHQSLLFKYIAERSIDLQKHNQNFDFDRATLEQLLEYEDMRELIMESLAFVPEIATIADAKRAMEGTENCQDVFITHSGSNTDPVVGWLTNVDISNLTG